MRELSLRINEFTEECIIRMDFGIQDHIAEMRANKSEVYINLL